MRKNKIIIIWLALFLVGCAYNSDNEFKKLYASRAPISSQTVNKIRRSALQDTANSVAAQAALFERSKEINALLWSQSRELERIYNFDAMLLDHNVLPPVLVEARDTLNLSDSVTIRLADRDYQIVSPARFVTVAPNWRDYLWMHFQKPEAPNITLLPKNKIERKIWKKSIQAGWKAGSKQAKDIFFANLNRLRRDLNGMILYRKLYAQNIVSAPFVSQADLGITGGGDTLRVNDRILRITAMSELNPDSSKWRAALDKQKKLLTSCCKKKKSDISSNKAKSRDPQATKCKNIAQNQKKASLTTRQEKSKKSSNLRAILDMLGKE